MSWINRYAGWGALVLLVSALFSGLIASNVAFPLTLLVAAGALAAYRYWQELKAFDFWALDEWLRMRHAAIGVPAWHAPHHAAEIYCSQVVVRTRNEAASEMNILMMELIRSQDSFSPSVDPNQALNGQADRNAKYDAAQIRFNQCNTALSREMLTYLARGDLLARGLPTRDDVALSERIIPTSRWRVMTLDIAKAQATGMGWHYTGIIVGVKPKPRKTNKPPAPPAKPSNPNSPSDARAPGPQQMDRPRPPRPSA